MIHMYQKCSRKKYKTTVSCNYSNSNSRICPWQMFFKISALKNDANFTRKTPVLESVLNKVAGDSSTGREIFKNTFVTEHLRWLLPSIF